MDGEIQRLEFENQNLKEGNKFLTDLLIKYISHVNNCAGISCLSDFNRKNSKDQGLVFEDHEWETLKELNKF